MLRHSLSAVAIALLTWAAFLALALSQLPEPWSLGMVDRFYLWDSELFHSIAQHGYLHDPNWFQNGRSWEIHNIVYPPLYPWLSRLAHSLFDLTWPQALVLVANLACILALSFLVLIARRLQIRGLWLSLLLLVFALYPGSIWLLAAYSDSLSMALALAILFVAQDVLTSPTRQRGMLLFVLGVLLGLTHFRTSVLTGGAILMGVTWWLRGELDGLDWPARRRLFLLLSLPVAGAACAMLGFFAYCQLAFGEWDAYQQTIFSVWGPTTPDFLQVFDWGIYRWFEVSLAQDQFGQSTPYLGRFLATWMLTLSVLLLFFEIFFGTTPTAITQRLSFSPGLWALLLSMAMQYFLITMRVPSLSNFTLYPMPSVRYLIPCALLLGLYLAQLMPEVRRRHANDPHSTPLAFSLCVLLALGGLALQLAMFELFFQRVLQG